MKHLLKLGGMTPEEILHILDVADEYKRLHKDGVDPKDLQGKAVALVFAKNSTRTRTSLEVGIYQMGGLGTYLSAADMQIARGEPIQDTARVLGRYYDAIVYRTFKQSDVDALARYSGVPVVSGMTDYAHPLQVLTDLMTVRECKGKLAGLKAGFGASFFAWGFASGFLVSCLTGCGSLPDARYSPRSLTAVSRVRASSRALTSFSSKVAPVLRVSPVSSAKVSITFLVLMPKSFAISVTLYLKSTIG